MYFYYMVAAMGPRYQKYIWWKKYLTTFQMASIFDCFETKFKSLCEWFQINGQIFFQVQFVLIFSHQLQLLFRECNYPKSFMVWIAIHGFLFLFLFSDFYKTKYSKPKSPQKVESNKGACMVNTFIHSFLQFLILNII